MPPVPAARSSTASPSGCLTLGSCARRWLPPSWARGEMRASWTPASTACVRWARQRAACGAAARARSTCARWPWAGRAGGAAPSPTRQQGAFCLPPQGPPSPACIRITCVFFQISRGVCVATHPGLLLQAPSPHLAMLPATCAAGWTCFTSWGWAAAGTCARGCWCWRRRAGTCSTPQVSDVCVRGGWSGGRGSGGGGVWGSWFGGNVCVCVCMWVCGWAWMGGARGNAQPCLPGRLCPGTLRMHVQACLEQGLWHKLSSSRRGLRQVQGRA